MVATERADDRRASLLAAESFCFAFYECLLFSEVAIPVVGRFGNPAEVIRETGAGVVMPEMSAAGLVSACVQARQEYPHLAAKRAALRERLRSSARDYPRDYLCLLAGTTIAPSLGPSAVDLAALEASEFAARSSRQSNERPPSAPATLGKRMANAPAPQLERLTTDLFTMSSVEHLHRYAIAADLCRGKDALDIASGEGYGSNLLAKVAKSVVGVDISSEVIKQASVKYARANLTFRDGAADAIPLGDSSVDVVVSFETLEHHDKHEGMLAEIKRVLRPDGIMIISTPDKLFYSDVTGYRNAYHVKELYLDEFKALIERFLQLPTPVPGSVVRNICCVRARMGRLLVLFRRLSWLRAGSAPAQA
jgi:2-polyprenyl-3-methyl-5-hydroxy-6-metoxy-1,4-benzoquinol methylase